MRDEYDIENLNPRRNPCTARVKKQITLSVDIHTIEYFKREAAATDIPYQALMEMYLTDCAVGGRELQVFRRHK